MKTPSKKSHHDKIPYLSVVPELTSYGFVALPLDGKKPIFKRWNKLEATPDRLYVFENYNIGVLTGLVSGITVLDIDVKDDGLDVWNSISSAYPEIVTPMVRTGSGGIHIYFQYNKKIHSFSRFKLRGRKIGWDLMNNDRLVVAPPSITTNKYEWIVSPKKVPLASMPWWLEEYLLNVKSFK